MPGAKLDNEAGYSLIEVVVAILLLSIAIIPMVSMFDAGLRAAVLGGNYDKARALANSNLEAAKANPPDIKEKCLVKKDADGPLDKCEIQANSVHVDAGSSSASFESGNGDGDEDLNMTKVTVIVKWDGNEYKASGIVGR